MKKNCGTSSDRMIYIHYLIIHPKKESASQNGTDADVSFASGKSIVYVEQLEKQN